MNSTRDTLHQAAQRLGYTHKEAKITLSALLATLQARLKAGETVQIRGFGTLRPVQRQGRPARNPRTGEVVYPPPGKTVAWKPWAGLRKEMELEAESR